MKKIFWLLLIVLGHISYAQKYSNEFLNIGVGARALGMANSIIASTEDVTAGYWNPSALLLQKNNIELGLMHAEYFAGIAKYDYLGVSKIIDSNSIAGISILRFGIDNIPNTLDLIDPNGNIDYSRITTFSATDLAVLLSYARKVPSLKGVLLGSNFKIINRKIGPFATAWGFGIDASATYHYKEWRFAAMAKDITGTFNAWSFSFTDDEKATLQATGNDIPSNSLEITKPSLILGTARTFTFKKDFSVLGEINLFNTFDGKRNTVIKTNLWSMEPRLGLELGYKKMIFFRAGIGNIQKQLNAESTSYITSFQINIGAGIHYKIFTIDYAMSDIGDNSIALYSNIFSVKIDINPKK
ncbi:MAG: PorV/PorQ family protein [Bacteroidia bacterium]|nr:PorV/PorQ family protein [Bacteroidia bacterium]